MIFKGTALISMCVKASLTYELAARDHKRRYKNGKQWNEVDLGKKSGLKLVQSFCKRCIRGNGEERNMFSNFIPYKQLDTFLQRGKQAKQTHTQRLTRRHPRVIPSGMMKHDLPNQSLHLALPLHPRQATALPLASRFGVHPRIILVLISCTNSDPFFSILISSHALFGRTPANSIEACPTPDDGWPLQVQGRVAYPDPPPPNSTLYYLVAIWVRSRWCRASIIRRSSELIRVWYTDLSQGYKGTYNSHAALLLPILGVNITWEWVIGSRVGPPGFAFKGNLFPIAGQCRMGITSARRFPTPDRLMGLFLKSWLGSCQVQYDCM